MWCPRDPSETFRAGAVRQKTGTTVVNGLQVCGAEALPLGMAYSSGITRNMRFFSYAFNGRLES